MTPTPEQAQCVDYFATGRKLRINAYAGTGKTSTLKMLARATKRRGVYLAFNSAIAKEAGREFPRHVRCSTTHGLAFRAMASRYNADKMTGKLNGGFVAAKLGLKPQTVDIDGGNEKAVLSARGWGFLFCDAVGRWLRSGDEAVSARHALPGDAFPTVRGAYREALANKIVAGGERLWDKMRDPADPMPLTHDGYLKLWALDRPTIPADFILLDEAQDTNGVVLALMAHQPCQLIAVGDRHQQIYEWRGARNAMVELPADLEARLSQSWRFGPAIAENASAILRLLGETVPLRGNPDRPGALGEIEAPDAILCRNNGTLIGELAGALDRSKRPFIVGGVDEILTYIDAAEKLMNSQVVERPLDFFGFANWHQVRQASEGEDGGDLRRWVKLMDDYGTAELRAMLEGLPIREDAADLVLSTGHKSKGREWSRVRLADDFLRGINDDKKGERLGPLRAQDHAAELRLYYVAATRGRDAVEIPASLTSKLATLQPAPEIEAPKPAPVAEVSTTPPPAADPADEEFERIDEEILSPIKLVPGYVSPATAARLADVEMLPGVVVETPAITAALYPEPLRKCSCDTCGYTVGVLPQWLEIGPPICPMDGVPLAIG